MTYRIAQKSLLMKVKNLKQIPNSFVHPQNCISLAPVDISLLHIHSAHYSIAPAGLTVQFSSVTHSCLTLCDPMNRSTPGLPVHHQLLEFRLTSIESVMPSSHLILCRPLLLLPPIPPSIRVFSNESTLRIRWPKY